MITSNTTSENFKTILAAVLDDCHGISSDAYNTICNLASTNKALSQALEELSEVFIVSKGRVFLHEDWKEE
jgi:4-hydroxy-3-methylbut-2-enyl diphosphate reductase IspH